MAKKPINHEAKTISEAFGVDLVELFDRHNAVVNAMESISLSMYGQALEENFSKRELVSIMTYRIAQDIIEQEIAENPLLSLFEALGQGE